MGVENNVESVHLLKFTSAFWLARMYVKSVHCYWYRSHPPGTHNFHSAPAGRTAVHSTQRYNAHVHRDELMNYSDYKAFQCAGGKSIACNDMP